ncbi:hypothetical protein ASE85_15475 [Sphingobium sp. Leaf26]|uniref:hypothetical protein n=1 Tax=Sphingobium sp. Leaf26 TaxID=1735693 RepID=UPI000712421E|nr:hypothetical protein [Sphingobium sp. Leaf26]KQM97297.1 hypothetical protein ASE85_15475 [Sphingobium sp. Leaf26]
MHLLFIGGRLETSIGMEGATGSLRGRMVLSGTGDTIREALAKADGHARLVVRDGRVKKRDLDKVGPPLLVDCSFMERQILAAR